MATKNEILAVRALRRRKARSLEGKFIVEGKKVVEEALSSGWQVHGLYARADADIPDNWGADQVTSREMERMSALHTPPGVLAVIGMQEVPTPGPEAWLDGAAPRLAIALDGLSDPGNLGTIIRTADWFGIAGIFAGTDTVDRFNPKVVQATMGALFRVPFWQADLVETLRPFVDAGVPVSGLQMEGHSVWSRLQSPSAGGRIIVIGSESHGLSEGVKHLCSEFLHIPGEGHSESLNASMAAGIAMAVWDAGQRVR